MTKKTTNTQFGTLKALNAETPKWATWSFRAVIIFTTALTAWIAATHLVTDTVKFEIILVLKGIDFITWGLGRMTGNVTEEK